MVTIKSYTDISQSKTLSKILPIESADMFHFIHEVDTVGFGYKKDAEEFYSNTEFEYIPAWSLAALLSVLPAECECMSLEHINYGNNHKKYFMSYVGGENTDTYDNPIDACYEMILKLNELNLI